MTESNETPQPKKISLQDAIKQKLANKKNDQSNNKSNTNQRENKKTMKSQQSKKTSMTRRKIGG
ncbi:hypothetical protein [Salipaludibacillus daqingensis]|uniref:hypothetical protein n=1 Tax=Salipaludibacillus daqingensis TaxID=3041001 RepID=UPI0024758461|nr:hypothetical protein [Salipaludibacillus daqingensis]